MRVTFYGAERATRYETAPQIIRGGITPGEAAQLVPQFDTVASLKAASDIPDKRSVILKGRDAAGDSPTRLLVYDAAATDAPNDVTVFAPALLSGRFVAKSDQELLGEWFGVRKVDLALNTGPETSEAIRSAVEIAAKELGGRRITLTPGKYFVESPLVDFVRFKADANVPGGLVGPGQGRALINLQSDLLDDQGNRLALINISGPPDATEFSAGTDRLTAWGLSGINLIGNNHRAHAIRMARTSQSSISDISIRTFNGNAWRLESVWGGDFYRGVNYRCGNTEEQMPSIWIGKVDPLIGAGIDTSNACNFSEWQVTESFWESVRLEPDCEMVHYNGKLHGRINDPRNCTHFVFNGTRRCSFNGSTTRQDATNKEAVLITDAGGMKPHSNRIVGDFFGLGENSAAVRIIGGQHNVVNGCVFRNFANGIVTEDGALNFGDGNVIGDNAYSGLGTLLVTGRKGHVKAATFPREISVSETVEVSGADGSRVAINNNNGMTRFQRAANATDALATLLSLWANGNLIPSSGAQLGSASSPWAQLHATTVRPVKSLEIPTYTAAELGDRSNAINTGKVTNRTTVYDSTNGQLVVAQGSTATSAWKGALATITPA